MWLLDPYNMTITDSATSGMNTGSSPYTPATSGANLNAGDLGNDLNSANITVETTSAGSDPGTIQVTDAANQLGTNWTSSNTLTLQADDNIVINTGSALAFSGTGKTINLTAGNTTTAGGVTISSTIDGAITLNITAGTTGSNTIGAALGGITGLTAVTVTGPTTVAANVMTTGAQTYNNAVTMGASSVTLSGGTITLPAVSLGADALTINTSSATSAITGIISGTSASSLTMSGAGTLDVIRRKFFLGRCDN